MLVWFVTAVYIIHAGQYGKHLGEHANGAQQVGLRDLVATMVHPGTSRVAQYLLGHIDNVQKGKENGLYTEK